MTSNTSSLQFALSMCKYCRYMYEISASNGRIAEVSNDMFLSSQTLFVTLKEAMNMYMTVG